MSETTTPSTEQLDSANLAAEGLEAAKDELTQIQTVLDYYNESSNALNFTLEQATALKEEVAAKSDWVDYLATRDYENVNGVIQGADSKFRVHDSTERGRKRNNEHYDSTQETEYKDRSYDELLSLAKEAVQYGDKTIYEDVNDAILDKIAADAERNGFDEGQTDRLFDRVTNRLEATLNTIAVSEDETDSELDEETTTEIIETEDLEAEQDLPERSNGSRTLWYLRHPAAAMQLGFARLQQLPGRAVEGLARIYRNENGEVDKKKLGKHILIGTAVAGAIIAITYAAKKAGAEGNVNDAMDAVNSATNNVDPSIAPPTPPRGGGSSTANILPPNPALEQVTEHASKVLDIDLAQRPWDVAREVGNMLEQSTRETLNQAKDMFNQQYNTSFELVKIGGVEQYMNGPHSMSPEQQQLFNEILAKLATG